MERAEIVEKAAWRFPIWRRRLDPTFLDRRRFGRGWILYRIAAGELESNQPNC